MNSLTRQTGFTLLELLVTLVVLLGIATIGIPSAKSFMQSNQLTANTNLLISGIYEARSRAILKNEYQYLCSRDGELISGEDGMNSNWSSGWYVTSDSTCGGVGVDDQPEEDIDKDYSYSIPLSSGLKIYGSMQKLVFDGEGRAQFGTPDNLNNCDLEGESAIFAGCFTLINASFERRIQVTQGGSIRSCKVVNSEDDCK